MGVRILLSQMCFFSSTLLKFASPVKPIEITAGYNFDKPNESVKKLQRALTVWEVGGGKGTFQVYGKPFV